MGRADSMDNAAIHRELEAVTEQLGVEIRVADLEGCRGGICRLGEKRFLLVDASLSLAERIRLMLEEIVNLPLETVFVRPQLRELLETRGVGFSPKASPDDPLKTGKSLNNAVCHSGTAAVFRLLVSCSRPPMNPGWRWLPGCM